MKACCLAQLTVESWRLYANYADPTKSADTYDYDSYRKALAFREKIIRTGGYVSVSDPVPTLERIKKSFYNADRERITS